MNFIGTAVIRIFFNHRRSTGSNIEKYILTSMVFSIIFTLSINPVNFVQFYRWNRKK